MLRGRTCQHDSELLGSLPQAAPLLHSVTKQQEAHCRERDRDDEEDAQKLHEVGPGAGDGAHEHAVLRRLGDELEDGEEKEQHAGGVQLQIAPGRGADKSADMQQLCPGTSRKRTRREIARRRARGCAQTEYLQARP